MNAPISPSILSLPVVTGASSKSFSCDMSNEDYHRQHDYISHSGMVHLLRSLAHFHAYRTQTPVAKTTPNMGTCTHTAILEPERFAKEFVVYSGRRAGKTWDAFAQKHSDSTILNEAEFARINGILTSLANFSEFPLQQILTEATREKSVFWTDEATGVQCRVRPDAYNAFAAYDLKTIDDARPDNVIRHVMRMDYDLQAAMYTEGLRALTGKVLPFNFIFVELDAPHGIWVYPAGPTLIESGMEKFRKGLVAFREYQESFSPLQQPYQNAITVLEAPAWRQRSLGYGSVQSKTISCDIDDMAYL